MAGDGNAVVQAGHGADAGLLQRGDDAREIVGVDPHVAVGEDDDVVTDARRHVDEVGDLAIQSVHLGFDHEIEIARRLCFLQVLDDRDGAIVGILHPEHDLNGAGIVLAAERGEVVEQSRLVAVQRLEDGDRRRGAGARTGRLRCRAGDQNRGRDQIATADDGDQRCRDR